MKKWLLTLFAACLIAGFTIPAYATESGEYLVMDQPIQQEEKPVEEPVVVGTLEELQAAVEAAEDGDIRAISESIYIARPCLKNGKTPNSGSFPAILC